MGKAYLKSFIIFIKRHNRHIWSIVRVADSQISTLVNALYTRSTVQASFATKSSKLSKVTQPLCWFYNTPMINILYVYSIINLYVWACVSTTMIWISCLILHSIMIVFIHKKCLFTTTNHSNTRWLIKWITLWLLIIIYV